MPKFVFQSTKRLVPSPPPPRKLNYSIADLLVKTVGTIAMKTVEHVYFKSAKYKYDRLGRITLECTTITKIPGEHQRIHKMRWFARDPHYSGKLSQCKAIMCSCDCSYWLFHCEYAMWSKGVSEIVFSNGGYPTVTNPSRRLFLCIAKGQKVATKRGLINIENVKTNDIVWTTDSWQKVSHSAFMGNKKVVRIKSSLGRELVVTPDHEILVVSDSGLEWLEAQYLTTSHRLCITMPSDGVETIIKEIPVPRHNKTVFKFIYPKSTIKLDATLAELMGYMVAEGSISKPKCKNSRGSAFFAGQNPFLIKDFVTKWKICFGKHSIKEITDGCAMGAHASTILSKLGFISGSYNKRVPQWIMKSNHEIVIAFLRGCYAGDGNFRRGHSTYATVSKKLAVQMHLLLRYIGVSATLKMYLSGVNKAETWVLRTSSCAETHKLFKILNPIRDYSTLAKSNNHNWTSKHNYLGINYVNMFYTAIKNNIKFKLPNKILKLNDVRSITSTIPNCTLHCVESYRKSLVKKNLITHQRLRVGGKPHSFVYSKHIEIEARQNRIRNIMAIIKPKNDWSVQDARKGFLKLKEMLPKAARELSWLANESFTFEQVVSVESVNKPADVYDLSVPATENFTVNGIVVHNCKHLLKSGLTAVSKKL